MNADIEKTSFDIPGKFKFKMDFPRATNYSDFNEIVKAFPHLKYVNSPTFDTEQVRYGDFYVIKSTNDDDIHKVYLIIIIIE